MAHLHVEARSIVSEHPAAPFDAERATVLFEPLLWGHLVGRSLKVVILELNVARVRGTLVGDSPEARCEHFASQLRSGNVRDQIIEEYPVLARSIVTATDYWVESAREFLRYLAEDVNALQDAFAVGGELGSLIAISGNAGDVHRHGRSVAIAEFSSGIRVVFRPRPLTSITISASWSRGSTRSARLRSVPCTCSRVEITVGGVRPDMPCNSRDEVERFYERFGAWLAILHVLNATDFHYENVIASGEFPDADRSGALPSASGSGQRTGEPEQLGWEALQRSVLRTGVLPFRAYDNEQSSGLDMSAMGGTGGQRPQVGFRSWSRPGPTRCGSSGTSSAFRRRRTVQR
jgi:lantibiotic modifying enzyme